MAKGGWERKAGQKHRTNEENKHRGLKTRNHGGNNGKRETKAGKTNEKQTS